MSAPDDRSAEGRGGLNRSRQASAPDGRSAEGRGDLNRSRQASAPDDRSAEGRGDLNRSRQAGIPTRDLRRFTEARVGLGRAGTAVPTAAHLDFQEAHARARDAVWSALDVPALHAALAPLGPSIVHARSAAPDRRTYLLRPDLGRRLAEGAALPSAPGSIAFLVADGLCATGVQRHAPAVLERLIPALPLPSGPIVVAEQARVALGDEVGERIGAAAVVVLIGERPGLSTTDSLGLYITWAPRRGRTDAERNCISNVRPGGLSYGEAAAKAAWLLRAAAGLGATGVALKDEMPAGILPAP